MLKSIGIISVSAALLLSPLVFADDGPEGSRSAQLMVTVTVVRGGNTASPEAPVQLVQCTEQDGKAFCAVAESGQVSSLDEPRQACTTSEQATMCWY